MDGPPTPAAGDNIDAKPFGLGGHTIPQSTKTSSDVLFTRDEFLSDEYKMTHLRRGKAIIINNKMFEPRLGLGQRTGTDVDAQALYSRFSELDFDVDIYHNLSADKLLQVMIDASKEDHTDADCFVCAILSHGEEGIVFGTDGRVQTKKLFEGFKGNRCPSLAGKPKIFFLQACQGQQFDDGADLNVADAKGHRDMPMDLDQTITVHSIPSEADFLIAYSVVPGYFSWRNSSRGSWFVQALSDVLEKHAQDMDLLKMMTRVSKKVALEFQSNTSKEYMNRKKQIPCISSMLTKDIYFKPK